MRVLVAHVKYRHAGGEDAVVEHEATLLRSAGVEVSMLVVESGSLDSLPLRVRAAVALSQGAHTFGCSLMREAIAVHKPDVVHAHNLFPLLGPAALQVAARSGCVTVATLHNYRLSCLAGTHLYDGAVCERCSIDSRAAGIRRACYRGSRLQSALYARGVRALATGIGHGVPNALVCLTDFQKRRYSEQGVPASRLLVKPNSVEAGVGNEWEARSGVLFVGRISPEKGIVPLVRAWAPSAPPLSIIGDGPQLAELVQCARMKSNVYVQGQLSGSDVRRALRAARVTVLPSLWYEGLPLTVLESLSEATPVVAFDGGALEGTLPRLVARGDFVELGAVARGIAEAGRTEWETHSAEALSLYNERFTDQQNSRSLVTLYETLLRRRRG